MYCIVRLPFAVLFAVIVLGAGATPAKAAFINTTDRGTYSASGSHVSTVYAAGLSDYLRDYFVFDLSGVTDPVSSASLRIFTTFLSGAGNFTLYDVTTSIPSLTAGAGSAAYTDLGMGTALGSISFADSSLYEFVQIDLNAAGLAYLNSNLGGQVAFGGRYSGDAPHYIFGFAGTDPADGNTQLVYEQAPLVTAVPAPPAAALFALGFVGLAGFRRLRGKRELATIA